MNTIHVNLKKMIEEKTVNKKEVMDEKLKSFIYEYYIESYGYGDGDYRKETLGFKYYGNLKTDEVNLHLIEIEDEEDNPYYLIRELNGSFSMLEDSHQKRVIEKFWLYVLVALRSDKEFKGINFFYSDFMMQGYPLHQIEDAKLHYILQSFIDWDTIKIKENKFNLKETWNKLLN